MPTIHWFRRDLRLDDNTALHAALVMGEPVLPVFVLDPAILSRPDTGPARVAFLFRALRSLDEQLRQHGSCLLVLRGQPPTTLARLAKQTGAQVLTFNHDHEPYARARDAEVTSALEADGVAVATYHDHLLFEPGSILTADGKPYRIFAQFLRKARDLIEQLPAPEPLPNRPAFLPREAMPTGIALPAEPEIGSIPLPPATEASAADRLAWFVAGPIASYGRDRNVPAIDGTSRLSPYLKFGIISARRCLTAGEEARRRLPTGQADDAEIWVRELIWRDFYAHLVYHFPHVEHGSFSPAYENLRFEPDEALLQAWQTGQTGYPIVDAGMRQMAAEAWMHNRARMIVAVFFCKDLLLDYRAGERHFMHSLMDGDLAANNGGWQWSSSTGADAQPPFRVFNPTVQSERCDPHGDYIRRFVPELANVPTAYIHAPERMPPSLQDKVGCRIGRDYPAPIVDHARQRERAMAFYRRKRIDTSATA